MANENGSARRRTPSATRDRLVAAAVDLFAERGYDGVRVRDIAERAGVTTGAIYAHYSEVAALLADAAGRAVDHAVEAVVHVTPDRLLDALHTTTSAIPRRRLSREQALLFEAFVAARREVTLRHALNEVLGARLATLQEAVTQAQDAGEMRDDLSPDALAWFLYLMPIGLLAGRSVDLAGPTADELAKVLQAVFESLQGTSAASSS